MGIRAAQTVVDLPDDLHLRWRWPRLPPIVGNQMWQEPSASSPCPATPFPQSAVDHLQRRVVLIHVIEGDRTTLRTSTGVDQDVITARNGVAAERGELGVVDGEDGRLVILVP